MTLLRRRGIDSFRDLNPDWELTILDGADIPIEGTDIVAIANRSDWARYKALGEAGGFYFDTDTIFIRPIPETWLAADVALQVYPSGEIGGIGAMGASEKGRAFFGDLKALCAVTVATQDVLGYQSLGIKLFWTISECLPSQAQIRTIGQYCERAGYRFVPIPMQALLPVEWRSPEYVWLDKHPVAIGEDVIGTHWYGGDHLSRLMEQKIGRDWTESSACIVAKAYRGEYVAQHA